MTKKTGGIFPLHPDPGARIVVAGGCGGIGRALVAALGASGCDVAVLDMPSSVDEHPPAGDLFVMTADATNTDEVEAAARAIADRWGALDGFVNLCGFTVERNPIDDFDTAAWRAVIDGNLNAAFLLSRSFVPLLKLGNTPSLVHAASSLAVSASPGYGAYSSAKAGILALTRMLATENAPELRVNAVAPSAVRTRFIEGGTGRPPNAQGGLLDLDAYGRALPLGRVAEVDDVVGPILFLLGAGSAYMTGQVLHINGGLFQP